MNTSSLNPQLATQLATTRAARPETSNLPETKEAFRDFVAGTFYREMLKSLRQSHDKPAYMHGGQAEDVFREQLDRQIGEQLSVSHGDSLVGDLYASFEATQLRSTRL
ncbi:rod-binding protein [Stratiformator vulcanicus]|uniref:Rod binding protein n=1 Tax=Stratiformator vulcanicus TaxID=2527980 RepID=A0A517R411_9PLAN|nr:rod-binding protein [Stratiformator vulcanicus]QDT38580.1 Rod binding protein [Stratiformator vulcanicus]